MIEILNQQLPDIFCELNLAHGLVEPGNSYSSLAHLLIGLFILFRFRKDGASAWVLGVAMSFLGLASFLFHASFTRAGAWFDLFGMSTVAAAISWQLARYVYKTSLLRANQILLVSLLIPALLNLTVAALDLNWVLLFAPIMIHTAIVLIAIVLKVKRLDRNLILAAVFFGLGMVAWLLDFFSLVCVPEQHILSGHVIWHIFTAAGLYFYYLHFRVLESGYGSIKYHG